MAIQFDSLKAWLRRRTGDTGSINHWSDQYLTDAVNEAVIQVVNDLPEGFTQILDLATNNDNQTIDLPTDGVVFTRAYGAVQDNKIVRTLRWISETKMTEIDPCWREGTELTHVVYSNDQFRIWLNAPTDSLIRCSVAKIPNPIIDNNSNINVRDCYRNLIIWQALTAMYGLTSNGAGKMTIYETKYLQAVERMRNAGLVNIQSNAQNEKRQR